MKTLILAFFVLFTPFLAFSQTEYYLIVDRNGTGNFRNIQQAIDSVAKASPSNDISIFIKKGVYKEKLDLPTHVCNVKLIGEDRDKTIINYDDHANIDKMGTFLTYTFIIRGNNITLQDLTVENSSAPMGQAVALHLEGDRLIFRNCRFLGNQDTVYAGKDGCRQYFESCYIEGTTDFIFGPATAWFERCEIFCKRNSYITAANTPKDQSYGYIFNHCAIRLADGIDALYLGRPWRPFAMTLFMNSELPQGIKPLGWDNWRNAENEKTARYMEYNNTGAGAWQTGRASWVKNLTAQEAKEYTITNVLKGSDNWNPQSIK